MGVNGSVVGTNSANYTYDPKDGDTVACQLLSDAICPSGNPALSNGITMVVYSDLPARLTITENANNVCPGENVSFTAVPFNGGSSPSYQWLVNGIKVGSNLPVYSYNPLNGDAVSCQLTSSNNCSAEQIVQSNLINMSVSPPALQPSFSFEQTDDCAPVTIKFKNNTAPGGVAYMWDFGDGNNYTTETTEDVTHIFHNYSSLPKVFNVSLKVITKFTHCFNVLTKQLTVKPEFFAGSQVNYKGCSPLVQKFENANPGAKSYRWMSDKNTLLSTEFQPTLTFNASGKKDSTFTVYLIAESVAGCIDTIVNTVKVSPALEKPSFTWSSSADCKSVTGTFRNTSPEGAELFVWDFDDGTINKTVHSNETVIHTFINSMDEPVIFNVKLTSINGTYCSLSETKPILVNPEYTAGYPVTFQGCTPLTRTFTNAYSGSKSYQWKTEKGVLLSQEMNPTLTFTSGIDQDSTHLIYLITESITGCKDTILNKVIVRGKSKGGFTISPSEGCAPLLVQFTNTSSSLIKSQEWSFGDSSDYSTLKSPRHTFINSSGADTIYKVTFVAFNQYGCSDTITSDIHLLATPQIDFLALPGTQTYPDRTIKLTNLTPPGNWTFSWNFGDQKPSLPGNVSEYQYDLPGEYVITLTAKGDRCESIERNKVIINPGTPMASFEPDTSGCAPLTVNFRNYSQNGSEYQWDFGNGNMSENFSPSTIYHEEGTYTVRLNVLNQHGVMSTTERTITVHPVPKALFDLLPNKVKIPKQDVTFFNYSENAKDYLWDFGDGNTSPDKEPVYQYTKTGLFDVTLFITSAEGCRDTLLLREAVEVFSDGLKVPNAFIPGKEGSSNGHYVSGDPRNNIFYPAVAAGDVVEYELMIFNRWGNLLFVSREIERGWDGYYNGRLCPQDVYIWKIRCKFISGSIITKSGDVTLIQ